MVWPLKHSLLSVGIISSLFIKPVCDIHAQDQAVFSHLSVNDGLSQSTTRAIVQDHQGFLWFGTRGGGLNRYDGYDFHVLMNNPDDPFSLSDNEIISIFEDHEGMLWVGTKSGGLNRYDGSSGKFAHYFYQDTVEQNLQISTSVNVIFEDSEGQLYVGLNDGIGLYDRQNDRFTSLFSDLSLQLAGVTGICEDNLGNLYFGTQDRLVKYNKRTAATEYLKYKVDPYVEVGGRIITLCFDRYENLWIGTSEGVNLVETQPVLRFIDSLPIASRIPESFNYTRVITETSDGNVWFGTIDGLYQYNPETQQLTPHHSDPNNSESLGNNAIESVYEDRVGTLWIGTWSGVNILDKRKYKFTLYKNQVNNPNSLSNNIVSSFMEDDKGIWIGTEQGGLNYIDRETSKFTFYKSNDENSSCLKSNNVKSLFIDSKHDLWVGTFFGGLSLLNRREGGFSHFLNYEAIYAMNEFPEGTLWIGSMSGLHIMDLNTRVIKKLAAESIQLTDLANSFILFLYIDSEDYMWIGTKYEGLFRYDAEQDIMLHFTHSLVDSTTLSNDFAICICEDVESNIWIGTNNGLNRFIPDQKSFKRYGQDIGLADNVINGLLPDDEGNLWIATNKGLSRYNDASGRIKHYDYLDGLQSNEFSRGVCFRSNSGELFFGGIGGFNSFYPDQIKENRDKPQIVITDFKLFNMSVCPGEQDSPLQKHISETEHITLSYKQSSFSFDFVALNFLNPEKNRYAYILEGYEHEWNQAGRIRTATYMNLSPGNYTFRVIGSNNDNIWNETGASVGIKVRGPYYKHPVALLLYAMVIAGMIWLLINIITFRQRKENEVRNERLEKKRLEERNQMRLQFFTNISHEFRTPLTLITGPLDKLIRGRTGHDKEYLFGLMRSNVDRMLRLVNQLLDFRKIENEKMPLHIHEGDLDHLLSHIMLGFEDLASQKMIELTYHPKSLDHEGKSQWFDEGIIDKVVYNLLSNAFKFTPEQGVIQLRLVLHDNTADIILQDTGKGVAREKLEKIFERYYSESPEIYAGTGIGLSLSKRLIDIHRGEIKVESEIGAGSTFTVTIPVSRESFKTEEIVSEMEQVIKNRPGIDILKEEALYPGDPPDGRIRINKTLLVVEDNEELLKYLLDHFNEFQTMGMVNGKEAYDWAVEKIPDIIISDVMMPGMDGIELCKQLKENYITSHIPIILLTAKSDIEQRIDGLGVGADAYVTKPFDNNYLTALVKNLLAQRKVLREKFSEISSFIVEDEHITGIDKTFLDKIEAIIYENISDPDFSVEQMLSTVHMSRSQLYRKFKALINKNPSEYIRILRLKYAVSLLNQKQYSVNEIAYMSGFGNVSYFITCFKKYYGKSPRRYIESAPE